MNQIDMILQLQKDLIKLYQHVQELQKNQVALWEVVNKLAEKL